MNDEIVKRLTNPPPLMIVSDLDQTMVDHDDPENLSLLRFNALWEASFRCDSLLVFSTGRSSTSYDHLFREKKPLLTPDITITSVGSEIAYGSSMVRDECWLENVTKNWDRNIVVEEASKFPELILQSEKHQGPYLVSYHLDIENSQMVTKELPECLIKRGMDVKIIYCDGIYFDIVPQGAGKGQALAYLLNRLKIEGKLPANILVCGDSRNDAELFGIPEVYGVMVSNASEELLQWHAENANDNPKIIHATERCASGIIQAMGHFKLGPYLSPRDATDFSERKVDSLNPAYEVVTFYLLYERWRRGEIENLETYITSMKASCRQSGVFVHPSGAEKSLHESIDEIRKHYGDQKGKTFWVWVDQVLATETDTATWVVNFDKWEQCGDERKCCKTTVKFSPKEGGDLDGLTWVHVQQTWSEGSPVKDNSTWIF